ncbi:MAG TPA: SIS domain-containing protein [Blastocatellia bacterium]|nr:SIS domain-containing protein [Blastocatellia bacterium]
MTSGVNRQRLDHPRAEELSSLDEAGLETKQEFIQPANHHVRANGNHAEGNNHQMKSSGLAGNYVEVEPIGVASPSDAVDGFFDLALAELAGLRTRAEVAAIEQAAELILKCESQGGRVHVTGIGKSEHVARYVASLLSSTGTPAYFLHATECVHGSAGQVRTVDVIIAVSNSGTTSELMRAVDMLREMGIGVIGVTGNRKSSLAQSANVLLYAGVENEGGTLNLVPRASILAKVYVLCALSVALEFHKGLTREQYAQWHPGGALGKLARSE